MAPTDLTLSMTMSNEWGRDTTLPWLSLVSPRLPAESESVNVKMSWSSDLIHFLLSYHQL